MNTILAMMVATFLAGPPSGAATLPGFRIQTLGSAPGFVTSLAVDSAGILYYTTQNGFIYRVSGGVSMPVAQVPTIRIGDSGLLGMALFDDDFAAVHYTVPAANPEFVTHDVISRIDLRSGAERVLHSFACDIDVPQRGVSPEHHGGNPVIAPDGSVFVGIGEYNGRKLAQVPDWNGGRIWRLHADGTTVEYVTGLRNPFDFAWDDARARLIVPDNGPVSREDELNVVTLGANCGWPWVFGHDPQVPGTVPPIYIWEDAIVPTGTLALSGANDQLRSGIVITGFYSKALHYIPSIDAAPLPDPIIVLDTGAMLIDVAEARDGTIYVASYDTIYRVITPRRGDCDGDGLVSAADVRALARELADAPEARLQAQGGTYAGSWGCDANGDDAIDSRDMSALVGILGRRRAAR